MSINLPSSTARGILTIWLAEIRRASPMSGLKTRLGPPLPRDLNRLSERSARCVAARRTSSISVGIASCGGDGNHSDRHRRHIDLKIHSGAYSLPPDDPEYGNGTQSAHTSDAAEPRGCLTGISHWARTQGEYYSFLRGEGAEYENRWHLMGSMGGRCRRKLAWDPAGPSGHQGRASPRRRAACQRNAPARGAGRRQGPGEIARTGARTGVPL